MLTVPSAPAAVSAPPGAMLMHSTNAPPMHPKHADADNFLHAEDADGDESGGMTHGSLPTLPTSPLQARAVQETLQSCLYAAGAAASAGAPTHIR